MPRERLPHAAPAAPVAPCRTPGGLAVSFPATVPGMADDRHDPIASTAAFRAFSDNGASSVGGSGVRGSGSGQPTRRRPGAVVYVTATVALAAILLGVLAIAL